MRTDRRRILALTAALVAGSGCLSEGGNGDEDMDGGNGSTNGNETDGERTEEGESKIIASKKVNLSQPIRLQVKADGDDYRFNYSLDGNFKNLGGTVSGDILSTNVAGGFIGNLIGLYATSGNDAHPE